MFDNLYFSLNELCYHIQTGLEKTLINSIIPAKQLIYAIQQYLTDYTYTKTFYSFVTSL